MLYNKTRNKQMSVQKGSKPMVQDGDAIKFEDKQEIEEIIRTLESARHRSADSEKLSQLLERMLIGLE